MISTSTCPARQPSGQMWRYRSSGAFRARHRNFLPWRVSLVLGLVLALPLLGTPSAHSAGIPDTAPAGTLASRKVLEIDPNNEKARRYLERILEEKRELEQIEGGGR